jgi:ABC-type antimicrobial peptide transport system permease subunit
VRPAPRHPHHAAPRQPARIGIRSALGAQPRQLLGAVFVRAARQFGAGPVAGVAVAGLLDAGAGGGLLHGRGGIIVHTLAATMAVVGLLAALGPARRSLRFAPSEALAGGVTMVWRWRR